MLGRDLVFIGRADFRRITLVQIVDLEIDPQPRARVALPPPIVAGSCSELIMGAGLVPTTPPSAHYS